MSENTDSVLPPSAPPGAGAAAEPAAKGALNEELQRLRQEIARLQQQFEACALAAGAQPVGGHLAALLPLETDPVEVPVIERLQAENVTLRAELAATRGALVGLQERTTGLQAQVGQLVARNGREPDDFASAVSHSLDTLQARLAGLSNPLTDFAVREFTIDAKVAVNITPLGTVEYRFIQPGEGIDPAAISNVKMTVVPVPKQTQAGTWSPVEFSPAIGVEEIRGIGRQLRQQLHEQGIYTVADLLHAGSRVRGTIELAGMLQVERQRVAEWLAHAQLLTIRDIDGRIAGVLYEIGVRSLDGLAAANPETLAAAFNVQVQRTGRKRVAAVTAESVTPWVRAARTFLGRQPQTPTQPQAPAQAQPQPQTTGGFVDT